MKAQKLGLFNFKFFWKALHLPYLTNYWIKLTASDPRFTGNNRNFSTFPFCFI